MVAYIVKLISDNRLRRKVLNSASSEGMAEALLKEQRPQTRSSLKWGLIFVALGIGVLFVNVLAIGFESPLAYALLLLATGAALLGYYTIEHGNEPAPQMDAGQDVAPADVTEEAPSEAPAESMSTPVEETDR